MIVKLVVRLVYTFAFMMLIVEQYVWASPLLLAVALAHIPIMWYLAHRNSYTHNVLYSGWTPVIGAMVISRLVLLFNMVTVQLY